MKIGNIESALEAFKSAGAYPIATSAQIYEIARANGFSYGSASSTFMQNKSGRGQWDLSGLSANKNNDESQPSSTPRPAAVPRTQVRAVQSVVNEDVYIPQRDPNFVPWGEYETIKKIVESRQFFPLYISGMSGNGKTLSVEQACAKAKREYVRVQISPETDEDSLIGGFRLVNGETVFQKGPVLKAMETGAVLLIDEIDRGSNKIMCLQGVLEGKPVLVKKTGETVSPAPGFTVISTANTKGRGSDDGRYVAAQVIDDAFIERFVASIDQPYPEHNIELKIVKKHMESFGHVDEEFANKLVTWSTVIRKTFEDGGVDEVISTRRLCHIAKSFSIFQDRMKAIEVCINRFEKETRDAFLDLYTKIDAEASKPQSDIELETARQEAAARENFTAAVNSNIYSNHYYSTITAADPF
jgi:MoxR-like ATPase